MPAPARRLRAILLESVLVGVTGAGLALLANYLSPRGLSLTRDYFPGSGRPASTALSGPLLTHPPAAAADDVPPAVAQRLRQLGFTPITHAEAVQLFVDPRREQERIVFVDARDDRHYEAGHIPGAHSLDHYRPEKDLPAVLAACQAAERVVVYCTGGACEDSEFAAITLRDAGLPADRLGVYAGGMNAWSAAGQPVERGPRAGNTTATPTP
ncbi:MAG: rhodanese-like domain-containing protein [Verrucomicrobiota bacterium]